MVFDLEDAVAESAKDQARQTVAAAVRAHRGEVMVLARVNAPESGRISADIDSLVAAGVAAIRVPKVESEGQVREISAAMRDAEVSSGLDAMSIGLECTIETAVALLNAPTIAAADARVSRLVFGAAGFAADVGATAGPSETELLMARSMMVIASRAAGLSAPVDGAYPAIADLDGLAARCHQARRLGFGACSAIHPSQLPTIIDAFGPDAAEVARAREVLAAIAVAIDAGRAVATLEDGSFIDAPIVEQARAILARVGETDRLAP